MTYCRTGCIKGCKKSADKYPATDICSSLPLTFTNTQKKKKKNRGAGAQNVADLLRQHVLFTHCVCVFPDPTKLAMTWPHGLISLLALSITQTTLAL